MHPEAIGHVTGRAELAGVVVGDGRDVAVVAAINVSPESFYAGSVPAGREGLLRAAAAAVGAGAAIIDVGARSTAPYGETPVGEDEEVHHHRDGDRDEGEKGDPADPDEDGAPTLVRVRHVGGARWRRGAMAALAGAERHFCDAPSRGRATARPRAPQGSRPRGDGAAGKAIPMPRAHAGGARRPLSARRWRAASRRARPRGRPRGCRRRGRRSARTASSPGPPSRGRCCARGSACRPETTRARSARR